MTHTPHTSLRRPSRVLATALGLAVILASGSTAAVAATGVATRADTSPPLPASVEVTSLTVGQIVSDAEQAIADARELRAAALDLNADVAAAGLTFEGASAVDVAPLTSAIAELDDHLYAPVVVVPHLTDGAEATIAQVRSEIDDLAARLQAAREAAEAARVAAEEAARRAAEEAAAAAARAAEEAARAAQQAPPVVLASPTGDNSPGAAQAAARDIMAAQYGWGEGEFACLVALWNKESGWNVSAYNRSSGATGIPQALPGSKMASAGADWATNAVTQVRWGLGYIAGRYGSPCNAWGHSQTVGWY